MLQAIGLTSAPRRGCDPAVRDLTFEARPGAVTALLGAPGAGKTTALRLMLELEPGRGITYFRGRPLHRIAHPAREVGVLLAEVPGRPSRTVRGQLRLLCAAAGVPVTRADEVLEAVGLHGLQDQRLGALSTGMERRLGLAAALLGDPHTLLLDQPAVSLSPREAGWLYELLRAHAADGGTVLCTTDDPKEAARIADHVVTIDEGRLVADQEAADFARTRLRPRVAVRTPHAARLAAVVSREARAARRSVEVVTENGNRLCVYGSTCAEVGETAFRHGILLHQLADETGDTGPALTPALAPALTPALAPALDPEPAPASGSAPASDAGAEAEPTAGAPSSGAPLAGAPSSAPSPGAAPVPGAPEEALAAPDAGAPSGAAPGPRRGSDAAGAHVRPVLASSVVRSRPAEAGPRAAAATPGGALPGPRAALRAQDADPGPLPPPLRPKPVRSPLHPLRYELRRLLGAPATYAVTVAVLVASAAVAVLLARTGRTPLPYVIAAWPGLLPLPPAALGAGLLGAFSFGDEYRYPVLSSGRGPVPRRAGLLLAKLAVTAVTALTLALLAAVIDLEALRLVYGGDLIPVPENWPLLCASWAGLAVGCAWAGLLAAGIFRATAAGVAAVLAVPVLITPLVQKVLVGPSVRSIAGLPGRLRELSWTHWPYEVDRWLMGAVHVVAQPVGTALVLSLTALICAYLLTGLRRRARW
ncbi:ATP-binding cassette domain-containing protein [Streptomyces sp. NPDC093595]|uniref:ABC transporter ATP-binding protein n=1 Tax=Streptomyces sp. NPDC093595 TaxID=3366045 RepID=UPI003830734B